LATIGSEAPATIAAATAVPTPAARAAHVESPLVRHLAEQRHVDLSTVTPSGPDAQIKRRDVETAAAAASAAPPTPVTGVRASPLARRRAAQLGVDLSAVAGTGPDGAVTEADVASAAAMAPSPASSPAPSSPAPSSPAPASTAAQRADRSQAMRDATAALMARSKREIPHFYLSTEIDLHASMRWLDAANAGRSPEQRLVPAAVLLKATAAAVRSVPEVNGFWTETGFSPAPHVHLGVAISLRHGGLIAPAIHDADTLTVDELMQRLRDLVGRARSGRLRQSEMADPTITVTNLGDMGVESVYGVIYPPQVAVVGFGRVLERPRAVAGMLAVRPTVTATLAADHRVVDGHLGGRYLTRIDELLQEPEEI
jgi:pyruvate dehydrogenase E2 component (dihydrolipoamide acetyltransferase)